MQPDRIARRPTRVPCVPLFARSPPHTSPDALPSAQGWHGASALRLAPPHLPPPPLASHVAESSAQSSACEWRHVGSEMPNSGLPTSISFFERRSAWGASEAR